MNGFTLDLVERTYLAVFLSFEKFTTISLLDLELFRSQTFAYRSVQSLFDRVFG